MSVIIHLEECEPERHPEWIKTHFMDATLCNGEMCPDTEYMSQELFPGEIVWVEMS